MPLYVGDYHADTQHLSCEQHGAYLLLLMHYWVKGEALPDDDGYLANVCRLDADAWLRHRVRICGFFQVDNGVWRHKRVDAELEHAKTNSTMAKHAAKMRWHSGRSADASDPHMPKPCPSPSPPLKGEDGGAPPLGGASPVSPENAAPPPPRKRTDISFGFRIPGTKFPDMPFGTSDGHEPRRGEEGWDAYLAHRKARQDAADRAYAAKREAQR